MLWFSKKATRFPADNFEPTHNSYCDLDQHSTEAYSESR